MEFYSKLKEIKGFEIHIFNNCNFYVSSSLMQISTKLHTFAKFSMVNIHIDPDFSFHLKISDILKPDVILKKSNSN